MKFLILISFITLFPLDLSAQKLIKIKRASHYIGKTVTVCDTVYSRVNSHYAQIFELRLGADVEHKSLIIRLSPYIIGYLKPIKSKFICVTGLIEGDKTQPVIFVKDTSQLKY
ncbi:hypothetical protein [Mucilaginibacter lappiensis]|jgi:hypothetical protein|uniref:hypothetical protein n=1 Tax=Mucilaginibacter lappiensis TaxID=354630 RepID=UPI003D2562C2